MCLLCLATTTMAKVRIFARFGRLISESCLVLNKNISSRYTSFTFRTSQSFNQYFNRYLRSPFACQTFKGYPRKLILNLFNKFQTNYGLQYTMANSSLCRYFSTPLSQKSSGSTDEPPPPSTDSDPKELLSQIEELNKSVEDLNTEKAELLDKYKRSLADSENLRKRLMKQIEDAKLFGIQGFCKDLLEVADVLSKATECVPKEEVSDRNPHLKNLYEGLIMTEAELKKVFKRHGLEIVNPLNEKFNPNLHEALFQQEVEGKEAGTVVVVSKPGYKLHERVIRPALVGVAKET